MATLGRRGTRGLRSFLAAAVVFSGIVLISSTALAQICPTATEREVVALYNAERAAAGRSPLEMDVRLVQSARGHSQDMASNDFFDHEGSNGSSFDERILAAGYPSPRSENIAAGYSTPESVVEAWMGSSGHRANILDSSATHVGVGYAYDASSTYHRYWTANMGRSSGSAQLPSPVCVAIWTNAASFSPGDTLTVSLRAENFGDSSTVDFYFGVVLPNGNRVLLFTNLALKRVNRSALDVSDWIPLVSGVSLASPFTANKPNLLTHNWAGTEPAGSYTLFLTAAIPGSFDDGSVDEGDIVHSANTTFTFTP